ncbi:MAG: cytochrome c biogenesis protein CcsA [Proteobacteria bacterium]|nr:cytochrome c biogenesis protein CcsA [Pseudomonadota bacterium]
MDNIFSYTVSALNYSAFIYLTAAFCFFAAMIVKKSNGFWRNTAQTLAAAAFLAHTLGLVGRWYIGGIDRPPWTNLYESLVFFAWGASLFQLLGQWLWRVPFTGVIVMPLVFLLMGMAVMTPNKTVEPLIPALQSNWLKIHVCFGMMAYAAFTYGACLSFLHLFRNKVSVTKIAAILCLMFLVNLGTAGRGHVFKDGKFFLDKTITKTLADGTQSQTKDTYREYEGGPVVTRMVAVPGAEYFFWVSFLSFFAAMILMFRRKKSQYNQLQKLDKILFWTGTLSMAGLLGWLFYMKRSHPDLSLYSNPYLVMLIFTSLFFAFVFLALEHFHKSIMDKLPSADRLHELSYKTVLFAFPFQTLLLITGAVWAYYAWGRSWGWDPKETWALITWLVYLIYLHGKLLINWKPNTLSFISIIGFIVMVFAFLGVNLVLSGLHSYGSA